MGEAHKPTCSRRGSKGPVRREGAKGKRARDAATPPPRPQSSGGTRRQRGAPAPPPGPGTRVRHEAGVKPSRRLSSGSSCPAAGRSRGGHCTRSGGGGPSATRRSHECLAARGKPVIEEQSVISLHEVQKQVKVIHHRGTSTYMVRER